MSSTQAYENIKAALVSAVFPVAVVDFDAIELALQQQDADWIAIEDDYANEERSTMGCPLGTIIQEEGIFTFHIFTLSTNGLPAARSLADTIRAQMRWVTLSDGVQIGNIDPGRSGFLTDGRWSSIEVNLEFTRNTSEILV